MEEIILKSLFTYIPFVFFVLLMFVFVAPSKMRTRTKAIWAMVLLLCASKFMCFDAFGGDAFTPNLPAAMVLTWGWAYSGMCMLLALSCLVVPIRALLYFFAKGSVPTVLWTILLPLLSWTIAALGVYNSIKLPEIKNVEIASSRVPSSLDGYKIVHISDIHASSSLRRWRTEGIVRQVNEIKPDIVCLTGDYVDGMCRHRKIDLEPIRDLKAKDGVYFVTGNHEYYTDAEQWDYTYRLWGVDFLQNESVSPRKDLVVAGVMDTASARQYLLPDPSRALSSASNGVFKVLLQHRPYVDYASIFGKDYTYKFDLQLSGHTHGGVMPILRELVKRYNGGFVRGLYELPDGSNLYVSSGAGQWAGFPIRFFNDSEITVLTLKNKTTNK